LWAFRLVSINVELPGSGVLKDARYCFERRAFGRPIGDFQNTRFVLAEIATSSARM
jgi:alkylation response protein AidB-like acyl-CoA dehydrogenase